MSAARNLRPSRRQRLQDEIAAAANQFAAKLVDAFVEFEHAPPDNDEPKQKARRTPMRAPFVPIDAPPSTPEEIEEARRRMP